MNSAGTERRGTPRAFLNRHSRCFGLGTPVARSVKPCAASVPAPSHRRHPFAGLARAAGPPRCDPAISSPFAYRGGRIRYLGRMALFGGRRESELRQRRRADCLQQGWPRAVAGGAPGGEPGGSCGLQHRFRCTEVGGGGSRRRRPVRLRVRSWGHLGEPWWSFGLNGDVSRAKVGDTDALEACW